MTQTSVENFRSHFPLLQGKYVYLDSAASSPMCLESIESVDYMIQNEYANVHRGACFMAQEVTESYEAGRSQIANFLGASLNNIVYTSGATMSANILIHGMASLLKDGDGVILSPYEHHAVVVPWLMAKDRFHLNLYWMPLLETGDIDLDGVSHLLKSHSINIMSVTQMSNVTGYHPPEQLIHMGKEHGLTILMDGAQGLPNTLPGSFSVSDLGVDAYFFAGHKIFGPTGIGAFYATQDLLERMPPLLGGGDMIGSVSLTEAVYQKAPIKFEAGTPNITGVIGLKAALKFYNQNVHKDLIQHKQVLYERLKTAVLQMGYKLFLGEAHECSSLMTIYADGIHPGDMAGYLSDKDICTRSGFFCAEPLFVTTQHTMGGLRLSLGYYTTEEEVDYCIDALKKCLSILR